MIRTNMYGRRAIVTGGSSDLSIKTARALAAAGADVTLAVDDIAAGHDAARAIAQATGNQQVRVAYLDLADQSSIADFADSWWGPLNTLAVLDPDDGDQGQLTLALALEEAMAVDGDARILTPDPSTDAFFADALAGAVAA